MLPGSSSNAMCRADFDFDFWLQAYVGAIGQLLPEAEAQAGSEAARRAEQLGREALYIGSCLAAGIPRHTRTLYCLKLQESGPEHSRAPAQLWAAIALQLRLSPAQRQVGPCAPNSLRPHFSAACSSRRIS